MRIEPDRLLIDSAIRGDADACGEIYLLLKDSIYSFAVRMTNDTAVAEEITQDVFVFFVQNGDRFDPDKGSLFSFLCGVARNKILNHLTRSGTRLERSETEPGDLNGTDGSPVGSPLNLLLGKEFSEVLEEGITALSALQREALLLREMEELSYKEISEITETEVSVIKGRIHRARKALAVSLAPYLKDSRTNAYELHRS
ncbi:MAG: RNA polymerase sigma factor [Acidobacteria bacterium]|nr:MAG: RNA polymerase sigma factor [Acidobacteriota bacterium]REJ98043.1 MAG: RNA polymerase sigma factor [Acidobacteriota bacterium]REK16786.1 MAG: RNA polymerase sigma factor [Acidobacteriota bacterium]REK42697.1 MAG: RNA polymerase sigma factor [Acidobacteriota bacterium]